MKNRHFKGQNVSWRPKNWRKLKNHRTKDECIFYCELDLLYDIFGNSSIFWPLGHSLAFKISVFHLPALCLVKCSLKSATGWYKTNFRSIKNPRCKLVFLSTRAAFLALMILKLQNQKICEQETPNDPNYVKKNKNLVLLTLWPLVWPSQPLMAFHNFSEVLDA